jgi:hypothetical protein
MAQTQAIPITTNKRKQVTFFLFIPSRVQLAVAMLKVR